LNSHLVPQSIIDKNGVQKTVHVKPGDGNSSQRALNLLPLKQTPEANYITAKLVTIHLVVHMLLRSEKAIMMEE